METTNMETTTLAVIGGFTVVYVVAYIVLFVLTIIAFWKLFTKAGEKGWKSIIPFYNEFVLCRLTGIKYWMFIVEIVLLVLVSIFSTFAAFSSAMHVIFMILTVICGVYSVVYFIIRSIHIAKSYSKGGGFIAGLILLPTIFQIIIGFMKSAVYAGPYTKE